MNREQMMGPDSGEAPEISVAEGRLPDDQDLEYERAVELAYQEYRPEDVSSRKAKRRRLTSRTVMIALGVIAVILTAGGIAGPQIVYALEASRYSDIVQEVNEAASQAEVLEAAAESEALLYKLRSGEMRDMPARLNALSKNPGESLSAPFKAEIAVSAAGLSAALSEPITKPKRLQLAEKAERARESERPDPKSWFDVSGDALLEYAAVESAEVARAETGDTVTRERVQEAKETLKANTDLVAERETKLDEKSEKNVALSGALATVTSQVVAESAQASAAVLAADAAAAEAAAAEAAAGMDVNGTEISPEALQLTAAATELQVAGNITTFAVDEAGTIIGVSDGVPLPDGAMVIPGGDAVRLTYLLPRLESFVALFDAARAASEQRRIAEEAAEAEAARAAEEAARNQAPPYVPPEVPVPDTGGGATEEPTEQPGPQPPVVEGPTTEQP